MKRILLVVSAVVTLSSLAACAPPTPAEEGAPDPVLGLDEHDEGSSYNGWTQSADGRYDVTAHVVGFSHTLVRDGSRPPWEKRGGGGCLTVYTGSACTADGPCKAEAQNRWGPSAWGYCFSGACYARPGSPAQHCVQNPDRYPGTLTKPDYAMYDDSYYVLGCMTKYPGEVVSTSGGDYWDANRACGGTDSSVYMRSVTPLRRENCTAWGPDGQPCTDYDCDGNADYCPDSCPPDQLCHAPH